MDLCQVRFICCYGNVQAIKYYSPVARGNLNLLCNAKCQHYNEKSITINYEEQKLYLVQKHIYVKKKIKLIIRTSYTNII